MSDRKSIKLLSISLDINLLDRKVGDSLTRQVEYAKFFSHTTILVMNYGKCRVFNLVNLTIIPINAGNRLTLLIKTLWRGIRVYKENPYHLITTQDPLVTGLIGVWLKKLYKVPLNIQVHTDVFTESWRKQTWFNRIMAPYIGYMLRHADSIRVVSEGLKQKLLQATYCLVPTKIFIAPIRVDLDKFWSPAHYRSKITKFITVGRLVPEKNHQLMIKAFIDALKQNPNLFLTIVGDGTEKQKLSKIDDLGSNITFVGAKTLNEVADLLKQQDVFMMTSNYEGWGMVYVEAFAAGLPIISTPVAAVGELLQTDQNCLIASTIDDLRSTILNLASHPEEAYRLAKNGQMWIKANLESKVLVKKWIDGLYQTI